MIVNGWRELSSDVLVDSPYLRVRREVVATPTRPEGVDWMVVRRKQAVVIAPRTEDGRFLLIRQERVPIRSVLWEFPAGQIDGDVVTSEVILDTARRELAEETGHEAAGEWVSLGTYWPSAGFTDEFCHLFLASAVRPVASHHRPDANEMIIECRAFTPDELWSLIASGTVQDANTLSSVARLVAAGHLIR